MEETASSPCLFTSSRGPDSSQEISPPETESGEVQPQPLPEDAFHREQAAAAAALNKT